MVQEQVTVPLSSSSIKFSSKTLFFIDIRIHLPGTTIDNTVEAVRLKNIHVPAVDVTIDACE